MSAIVPQRLPRMAAPTAMSAWTSWLGPIEVGLHAYTSVGIRQPCEAKNLDSPVDVRALFHVNPKDLVPRRMGKQFGEVEKQKSRSNRGRAELA